MSITSPVDFLKDLDLEFFKQYRTLPDVTLAPVEYVEPDLSSSPAQTTNSIVPVASNSSKAEDKSLRKLETITSKVVTLGDFIDTDAVSCMIPAC